MTPADHANTVREALRDLYAADGEVDATWEGEYRAALAALDALQTQAERQALNIDDLLRQLDEAVRQRDHAQDALRQIADLTSQNVTFAAGMERTMRGIARAALGEDVPISGENFPARVQEAQRLLEEGDEAATIAYLLERPVEAVRAALGDKPAPRPRSLRPNTDET